MDTVGLYSFQLTYYLVEVESLPASAGGWRPG